MSQVGGQNPEQGAGSSEESTGDTSLERFLVLQNELHSIVANAKATQPYQQKMREALTALSRVVLEQQQEIIKLQGKIEITTTKIVPFAEIVKKQERERSRSSTRMRIRQEAPYVVTVLPKEETTTSAKTKRDLQDSINPTKLKVGVTNVRNIGRGGVLIETKKEDDLDKLIEEMKKLDNLKDQYMVKKVTKRNPTVILYNVNKDISKDDLISKIKQQNEDMENAEIEIRFSFKGKTGMNWVVSMDPDSFRKVKFRQKLYVGWERISVREFLRTMQCFNCWRYGHLARNCKNKQTCVKCSGEHDVKQCESTIYKCGN